MQFVEFFYDQACDVEAELSTEGCHLTQLADTSCVHALGANIRKVDMPLHFERIAWDQDAVDAMRAGKLESTGGADRASSRLSDRSHPRSPNRTLEQSAKALHERLRIEVMQFGARSEPCGVSLSGAC